MEKITGKFSFYAYFIVLLTLTGGVILYFVIKKLVLNHFNSPILFYVLLMAFIFIWGWLLFSELKSKLAKVEVGSKSITITPFLGLGKACTYNFKEVNNIKISVGDRPFSKRTYESLFLIKNKNNIVILSTFYYKNYYELKEVLKEHFKEYKTKF